MKNLKIIGLTFVMNTVKFATGILIGLLLAIGIIPAISIILLSLIAGAILSLLHLGVYELIMPVMKDLLDTFNFLVGRLSKKEEEAIVADDLV